MKVSIIMPVYNSGIFLDDAVNSILNQDFDDFELILVDDGSTDGSAEKCDKFASEDNRVKVIHQQNGGICNARNKALTIIQGEYIAFADHDDAYCQSLLRTAYEAAKNYDVDVLKFGMKEQDVMEGQIIGNRQSCYNLNIFASEDIGKEFFSMLEKGILNYVWDGLYRTDFIREHKIIFDANFKRGREDINFMLDVFEHRPRVATIPGHFYTHYIRKGFSTSSLVNDNTKIDTYRTFSHLKSTMDVLKVDYDAIRVDYVFYLVKSFLNSNICYLSRKWNSESHDILFKELGSLHEAPFLPQYFYDIPVTRILSRSRKYGICYYLFKHKLWHLLLSMYYNRERQKNTTLKRKITRLGGVILYNPDHSRLRDNISAILPQVDKVMLVENGSSDITYLKEFEDNKIELIVNDENMGIAYALNQVMQFAHDNGSEWALTLDQDSVVPSDLIETYMKLTSIDKVGMICCKIVDRNFGETTEQKSKTSGYEEVPMCITSASMLNWKAWKEVGGFAEEFFIDAVDFDMCLLLREHGYKIMRTNDTKLLHEVGHSQIKKLFGKEYLVYHHSPLRYYYMVRNGLYLGKRHHFIVHATIRAFRQIAMALIYEDRKKEKLTMMAKGFWHAIIGRYGKY